MRGLFGIVSINIKTHFLGIASLVRKVAYNSTDIVGEVGQG